MSQHGALFSQCIEQDHGHESVTDEEKEQLKKVHGNRFTPVGLFEGADAARHSLSWLEQMIAEGS